MHYIHHKCTVLPKLVTVCPYIAQYSTPILNTDVFFNKNSVYDYDGATSFDDLIGKVSVPVSTLRVNKGLKNTPAEQWLTLVDKVGNTTNAAGEAYGEILVR